MYKLKLQVKQLKHFEPDPFFMYLYWQFWLQCYGPSEKNYL